MLIAIILLFISAVVIGLTLVYLGLRHKKRSPKLGLTHAALVITGSIILFVQIATSASNKLNNVAALFLILALVGGGMVFALREDNKPPSMTMVTAHAIMGLIGVSLLLVNFFTL